MTHFTETFYLNRFFFLFAIAIWGTVRIFNTERFASLQKPRLKALEVKTISTFFLLLSILCFAVSDAGAIFLKYTYGLVNLPNIPADWTIFRPRDAWPFDKASQFILPIDMVSNLGFLFKSSSVFLWTSLWVFTSFRKLRQLRGDPQLVEPTGKTTKHHFTWWFILSLLAPFLFALPMMTLQVLLKDDPITGSVLSFAIYQIFLLLPQIFLSFMAWVGLHRICRAITIREPSAPNIDDYSSFSEKVSPIRRMPLLIGTMEQTAVSYLVLTVSLILEMVGVTLLNVDALLGSSLDLYSSKLIIDALSFLHLLGMAGSYATLISAMFPHDIFQ